MKTQIVYNKYINKVTEVNSMELDVMISANHIDEDGIQDKTVIVIDMLRATSVIITALNNGCKNVIPVVNVDDAIQLSEKYGKNYILGGERKAVKIEGFDCSNSPLEYTTNLVKNKTLILTTTNGTKAINASLKAKDILIGAIINAKAVSEKAVKLKNNIVIVNAGTYGKFSIDDFLCAGYIIDCILKLNKDIELTDCAIAAQCLYKYNENINEFMKKAKHCKRLIELGFEKDITYCCQKDITNVVPYYENGMICI